MSIAPPRHVLGVVWLSLMASVAYGQALEVPRRHDRPPGPPLSPAEAVAKMTVPEGFTVEIVAAEPDVVNPVSMFIDERGRYWITESLEYPRREPGPGRDRIKVLEDTDGDGKVDKVTVFAEGLNIPSGIAVGYGGVWVANAPDILFLQDTDGDGKADKQEVIVTGFGRTDTHELPNSFTWGPDGWLYGLNGVFNYCDVKYAETNPNYKPEHPGWKFTCAMWRIHPRTREFQIFAEGTSNPWGIAINDEGDFFISACVIDHLWHIVETGYYIRQGGPYPPHTWPIRSIVDHKHQKAAYCGITWFDSDCYPEEYRRVLYMGNIHGGCINADVIERSGSTYKGKPHPGFPPKPGAWDHDEYGNIRKASGGRQSPTASGGRQPADSAPDATPKLADFLTANDPWFMPVVQTTGPDGCLYILDWYDRYHCYQDANADPAGIERERGRLYRVRYKDTPHARPFDLAQKSDEELVDLLLKGTNEYLRQTAQRLLSERLASHPQEASFSSLWTTLDDAGQESSMRLRSLWTLASSGRLSIEDCVSRLDGAPPELLRWLVRFGCEIAQDKSAGMSVLNRVGMPSLEMPAPIRLQLAISGTRMIDRIERSRQRPGGVDVDSLLTLPLMTAVASPQDAYLQQIAWQNLYPGIVLSPFDFVQTLQKVSARQGLKGLEPILIRAFPPLFDTAIRDGHFEVIGRFLGLLLHEESLPPEVAGECLAAMVVRLRTRPLPAPANETLQRELRTALETASRDRTGALYLPAVSLRALWGDAAATQGVQQIYYDKAIPLPQRIEALQTLIAAGENHTVLNAVSDTINDPQGNADFRVRVIESLGIVQHAETGHELAKLIVDNLPEWEPAVRPKAIEILTQRPVFAKPLLAAIQAKEIDKDALNLNQLRRIATFKDESIQAALKELYGAIREGRDPNREGVVNKTRDFLNGTPGDPVNGEVVFKKVCAQCHKLYGEGAEVGPDITRNGRNNWEQLLWNLLDPSQVIGPGYQARILITDDGRTLTGLPVEESDQRVVLKVQGGKLETIPREQIEIYKVSELSMMPDQLERQVTPQELADLMSFLAHDRHPSDPEARLLPGAPSPRR